jgi:hypothetical protein
VRRDLRLIDHRAKDAGPARSGQLARLRRLLFLLVRSRYDSVPVSRMWGVEGDVVDDRRDQAGVGEHGAPFAEREAINACSLVMPSTPSGSRALAKRRPVSSTSPTS